MSEVKLILGDCLEKMKSLSANSVDSIVTDPPYGIKFMSKKWDYDVPKVEVWAEALRVLKPGGHMLCACGTRTQHRMVVNIEDAGFEIRDVISWVYGSGFPKSMNISKVIDKSEGVESQWVGWGTALKPACEFFTLARKPLSEKTIAANVLKWGAGGLNIEGCRVRSSFVSTGGSNFKAWREGEGRSDRPKSHQKLKSTEQSGRFPANLIHDGSQEVLELFPETKSGKMKAGTVRSNTEGYAGPMPLRTANETIGDSGSAARFFYCAKTSKKDRGKANNHPTVKPTELMQYLCRLITPPSGIVLDPYMGSGSTGKAALLEELNFIGIELDEEYFKIAEQRIRQ